MDYNRFVFALSDNLLDRLPYERVCDIRQSRPRDRFGIELKFSDEEMHRFLDGFEETFGFVPLPQSCNELVTMQELHNNVKRLIPA